MEPVESSLEEDLDKATMEADEESGLLSQTNSSAEMQPILSRHANTASSKSQQRVQRLDWLRACSDVEPVPGKQCFAHCCMLTDSLPLLDFAS